MRAKYQVRIAAAALAFAACARGAEATPDAEFPADAAFRWVAVELPPPIRMRCGVATQSVPDICLGRLAEMQRPDGSWKAESEFGGRLDDAGATAVSVLAFLGAGHTSKQGKYSEKVARSFGFLAARQAGDGALSEHVLSHALGTLAACECLNMTAEAERKALAEKSLKHLLSLQNGDGGWGKGGSRLFESCFAALALKSARISGMPVDPNLKNACSYFEKARDPKAIAAEDSLSYAAAACGALAVGFRADGDQSHPILKDAERLPAPSAFDKERPAFLRDYLTALACFQIGDERWKSASPQMKGLYSRHAFVRRWKAEAMKPSDDDRRKADGLCRKLGHDEWSVREAATKELVAMGRNVMAVVSAYQSDNDEEVASRARAVLEAISTSEESTAYTTAMCAMCIEIYYKYLPIYR